MLRKFAMQPKHMNLILFFFSPFCNSLRRFSKSLFNRKQVIGLSCKESKLVVITAINLTILIGYGMNMSRNVIQFNLGVHFPLFIENIYAIPNDSFAIQSIITTCRNVCFIIATFIDSFIVTTFYGLAYNNIFGFLPK